MAEGFIIALANFCGFVGTLLGIVFFLSPAPSMIEGLKTKILKDVSIIFLIVQGFQCSLWFIYGYKISDYKIISCNFVGLIATVTYISIYLYINEQHKEITFAIGGYGIGNIALYIFFTVPVLSVLVIIVGFVFFTTFFIKIRETLATKDAGYTNNYILVAALLCGILWLVYGAVMELTSVWLTNGYLLVINIISVIVLLNTKGYISDDSPVITTLKLVLRVDNTTAATYFCGTPGNTRNEKLINI
jgi:uncharacterized protein with PQ loop repeat